MIFAFLAKPIGKAVAGGLALVLAGLLFWAWVHGRERAAVNRHEQKVTAETLNTARRADEAAAGKSEAVRNEVEQTNEQARDAARNSADPLRDGFSKLRDRTTADRPATR